MWNIRAIIMHEYIQMIKPMTMAKQLFLFDVDDTIADSGRRISAEMVALFNSMPSDIEIGIVGGRSFRPRQSCWSQQYQPA